MGAPQEFDHRSPARRWADLVAGDGVRKPKLVLFSQRVAKAVIDKTGPLITAARQRKNLQVHCLHCDWRPEQPTKGEIYRHVTTKGHRVQVIQLEEAWPVHLANPSLFKEQRKAIDDA